jgi:hypothetical protein
MISWRPIFRIVLERADGCRRTLKEILYGMMLHEMDLELMRERNALERLFMLVVFGDLVGLPIMPPYYSMRLLPYVVPLLRTWKRSVFRERDLTDIAALDI